MSYTPKAAAPPMRLWTEADVAAFLGKSTAAVKKQRQRNAGPPHYTIGRSIRYNPRRVAEWVQQQSVPSRATSR